MFPRVSTNNFFLFYDFLSMESCIHVCMYVSLGFTRESALSLVNPKEAHMNTALTVALKAVLFFIKSLFSS